MSQQQESKLSNLKLSNDGKHLSVAGLDLESIPEEIHGRFGGNVESLDFSFNNIKFV